MIGKTYLSSSQWSNQNFFTNEQISLVSEKKVGEMDGISIDGPNKILIA